MSADLLVAREPNPRKGLHKSATEFGGSAQAEYGPLRVVPYPSNPFGTLTKRFDDFRRDLSGCRVRQEGALAGATRVSHGGVLVLVGGAVFNTDEAEDLGLAGSIPVRLRHSSTLPRCHLYPRSMSSVGRLRRARLRLRYCLRSALTEPSAWKGAASWRRPQPRTAMQMPDIPSSSTRRFRHCISASTAVRSEPGPVM
jgi:hypothetical protein